MSNITKLAVLGVLMEKSMHGYEIKKHIEERMGDYTDVKFGSIYYFLSSFLEDGYVAEPHREGGDGGDQERQEKEKRVYTITEEGQKYFYAIAAEELHAPYRHIDPIGVLLNFIYLFPREEVISAFRRKIGDLEKLKEKALTERTKIMGIPGVSGLIDYLFTHTIHHVNVEIQWMEDFINYISVNDELFPKPTGG
jgi:DNA-binding PadR family transcriptional regulator